MKMNSISFKLISIALLITTIVLTGLGFYGYQEASQRLSEQQGEDLGLMTRRLQLNLPGAIWNYEKNYIRSTLESEAKAYFIRGIYVLDDHGGYIDGIQRNGKEISFAEALPENVKAGAKNVADAPLVYEDPDMGEKNNVGSVLLLTSDAHTQKLLREELNQSILRVAILDGILLLLFALAISRMTKPLGVLQSVASSIADGNYDLDLEIKRKDEIGDLADSFNTMKQGIKKKVQDLRDLNVTGNELTACSTQEQALEIALKALSVHSNVKNGSVYLFNADGQLEMRCFYPPRKVEQDQTPRRFSRGEGIIGLAADREEILYIKDSATDERFVQDDRPPISLICVPLRDANISLGVLNLSGAVGDVRFEESDREYAETIARQLVATIKNIRMRETIEEQNRNLETKVEERTSELRKKNYDIQCMMQNMQQGLFTVIEGGQIHSEYAKFLENIFETEHIAGRNVVDLLFTHADLGSNDLDQNRVAIDALLGQDEMMFDFNAHLLAKEYTCEVNGKKKILALDWNAIAEDGEIDKLMVTVRDVTLLKALEAEAESQKKELDLVSQLLKISEQKYLDFERGAEEFMAANRQEIKTCQARNEDTLALLFRNMHTIKGNARTFGFTHLTDVVHEVESTYSALRQDADMEWNQEQLLKDLDRVEAALSEYAVAFREVLGRGGDGTQTHSGLDTATIEKLQQCIADAQQAYPDIAEKGVLKPVQELVELADTAAMDEVLADVIGSLSSISRELGKENPKVEVHAEHVRIKRQAEALLNNVFSHLLRNSIDHGIETPDQRAEAGKEKVGHINLETDIRGDHLEIHVRDDGRGVDLDRLFRKGVECGVWTEDSHPDDEKIAELIFHSGVSTKEAVSSISGRGVGMDAVRQFLKENGGDIGLHLLGQRQNGESFVPFETVVILPHEYFREVAA